MSAHLPDGIFAGAIVLAQISIFPGMQFGVDVGSVSIVSRSPTCSTSRMLGVFALGGRGLRRATIDGT